MPLSITVGSIAVTINALASADPVATQPGSEAATYSAFAESIVKSGLAATVFDAIPAVANFNTPALAKVRWPNGYGTTTKPWGQPYDPVNGYPEIECIDDPPDVSRWTDTINRVASSRKSFLDDKAELATAIATGIKSAIEANFRCGRATLSAGSVTVSGLTFTAGSEIILGRRTLGSSPGHLALTTITPGTGTGSFIITSSSAGDDGQVSWLIVG